MTSKNLRVQVLEGERQVVSVRLPAIALKWMETLMPDHVLKRIKERNIDLRAIKEKAQASGMVPQLLFQMESGKRSYFVSLE